LAADVAHTQAHLTFENLEPVLGGPDQMIPMVENTVAAGVVLHEHTLWKMSLRPGCGSFSKGYVHKTILTH
jgi:hypothetical protein